MAISCDPNDLAIAATCFMDIPAKTLQAIRIMNFCAFINGDTADCDPNALATAATCFAEGLDTGQMNAIETYLSCQIGNL